MKDGGYIIIVNCPHCGKEHMVNPDEIEKLIKSGKAVVADCDCGKLYTIEQGDECYFTT